MYLLHLYLTDMKLLVAVCFLAICAVTVSSRFADRRPFRQEYHRGLPQKVFRDDEWGGPPAAERATQLPNCKAKGQSCNDDCCMCKTDGGYYSCMICSSYDNRCFL